MYEFNKLGFIPIFFVLLGAISAVALLVWKQKKNVDNPLSQEEYKRYLAESIAIQPNNSVIFPNNTIDEVVSKGVSMLKSDNYNLLEGDIDV